MAAALAFASEAFAACTDARAFCVFACALATLACAASRLARAWSTLAWNGAGSMRAINCALGHLAVEIGEQRHDVARIPANPLAR